MQRSERSVPVSEPPAQVRVVGDVLRHNAERAGDATVLRVLDGAGGGCWSGRQLYRDAARVATALLERHPARAHVATLLPNGAEAVLLQLGVALAGMTLVAINPKSRPPEVEHALRLARARCLYTTPERAAELDGAVAGLPQVLRCDGDWRALLAAKPAAQLPVVRPGDLAQIQFTSGTSAHPKGVRISHHGMVVTAFAFVQRLGQPPGGVWLNPMPLFHTAGNVLGMLGSLWQGCEQIVMVFEPEQVLAAIGEHRVTLLSAAPTLLDLLMSHPSLPGTDTSALQAVFTGGQALLPEFVDRVEVTFGARLSVTFGMTETCGAALQTSPTDPDGIRRHTAGLALPGTDVRVAAEDGSAAPIGQTGELWLRGERLSTGYYDDPEATADAIDAEGWLHTGDLAVMEDSGACRVVGRLKDMIKSGGENVSPDEVEQVLAGLPGVLRAAVVGRPDERWGELVVAFIVAEDGARLDTEELQRHCRELLSPHKLPRVWHVVDQFPMTASGKLQRARLRELAADQALRS